MMKYNIHKAVLILRRTPLVLDTLLRGLPEEWTHANEGGDTWSPYDVMGHLIHGERTDWIARLEIILADGGNKTFAPFDRFAQFHESTGKSLDELLNEFKRLREKNMDLLLLKKIGDDDLERTGIHPTFGQVKLRNLLATWVAHDLDHISQVCRVMAKQYKEEVGPWVEYLRIMG
jgi:hypothetical protein